MAGVDSVELALAVAGAGGLGSLACALLTTDEVKERWIAIKSLTASPVNLNFFCHTLPERDENKQRTWLTHLEKYYAELNIDAGDVPRSPLRMPFNEAMC